MIFQTKIGSMLAEIEQMQSTLMAGMAFQIAEATKRDYLNAQLKLWMAMEGHLWNPNKQAIDE